MKRVLVFVLLFLVIVFGSIFLFKAYYFSPEKIRERQIETFNSRIEELKNTKFGRIDLTESINIRWKIKEFVAENHDIDYCENANEDAKYICEIDGEEWLGSDFKMDLPRNELTALAIFIDDKYIKLDTSKMFNPNINGELNKSQFKIKKYNKFYIFYGYFSDGAGTYTAHWKIKDGKSERVVLSSNDNDFE